MRKVKFISGLKVESRPMLNPDEIRYHMMESIPPVPVGDEFLATTAEVNTMVVPIHWLRKIENGEQVDTYIAYSKDVQELLEMPFDVLRDENITLTHQLYDARDRIDNICGAGLWRRLKFLFTKKI